METCDIGYWVNDDGFRVYEGVVIEISDPFVSVELVKDDIE